MTEQARTCSTCRHWNPIPMSPDRDYWNMLPGETETENPNEVGEQTGICQQDYRTRGQRPECNGILLY